MGNHWLLVQQGYTTEVMLKAQGSKGLRTGVQIKGRVSGEG